MKKQDQLFFLIKSLSKSEKRYYKLFSKHHKSDNNTNQLFNYMDQQDSSNDLAIKHNFSDAVFIKQLHVAKNYMSKQILRSLRQFHSESQVDFILKNKLIEIDILLKKDLHDQARIMLRQSEQLAKRYEKLTAIIDILSRQRRLILATSGTTKGLDQLNQLVSDEKHVLEELNTINYLWHQTINIYSQLSSYRNDMKRKKHPLDQVDLPQTLQGQTLYYFLQQSLEFASGDSKQGVSSIEKLIEIWEQQPHRIQDDPSSYMTALNNKTVHLMRTGQQNKIPEWINKIRSVPENYKIKRSPFTLKLLIQTYNIELELYRDSKEWQKGVDIIKDIEALIDHHTENLPEDYQYLFLYQFSYLYYRNEQLEEALNYINLMFRKGFTNFRSDIQIFAQFLNLMIHFELKHYVLLRYAVEACRRFLKKHKSLYGFEAELLKFFSRMSVNSAKKHSYLQNLQKNIFKDMNEKTIADVLDYIDFNEWIDRQLAVNPK